MLGLAPLRTESSAGSEPIGAWVVTGNFFQALGVRPALGRVLDVSDDAPGASPSRRRELAVLAAHFNGEARALGAIIDIIDPRLPGPVHATVVGVAQREFFWRDRQHAVGRLAVAWRHSHAYSIEGRLRS